MREFSKWPPRVATIGRRSVASGERASKRPERRARPHAIVAAHLGTRPKPALSMSHTTQCLPALRAVWETVRLWKENRKRSHPRPCTETGAQAWTRIRESFLHKTRGAKFCFMCLWFVYCGCSAIQKCQNSRERKTFVYFWMFTERESIPLPQSFFFSDDSMFPSEHVFKYLSETKCLLVSCHASQKGALYARCPPFSFGLFQFYC